MGRKAINRFRKAPTAKVTRWLEQLLIKLQQVDLSDLTIDDLASLSGKSKATIYKYFESKEDLVLAACQTRLEVIIAIVDDIQQDSKSPIKLRYVRLLEQFSEGVADISIAFLHIIQTQYPKSWDAINVLSESFVALLADLYTQGMIEGLFIPTNIELLKTMDRFFVSQIVTNSAIYVDSHYTLDYLVKDYLRLRLEGLMTR